MPVAQTHRHPAPETLFQFLKGALTRPKTAEVTRHLAGCQTCRDEVARGRRLLVQASEWTLESHHKVYRTVLLQKALRALQAGAGSEALAGRWQRWRELGQAQLVVEFDYELQPERRRARGRIEGSRVIASHSRQPNWQVVASARRPRQNDGDSGRGGRRMEEGAKPSGPSLVLRARGRDKLEVDLIGWPLRAARPFAVLLPETIPGKAQGRLFQRTSPSEKIQAQFGNLAAGKYLLALEPTRGEGG
jgi:anti-sigma factor RsiW